MVLIVLYRTVASGARDAFTQRRVKAFNRAHQDVLHHHPALAHDYANKHSDEALKITVKPTMCLPVGPGVARPVSGWLVDPNQPPGMTKGVCF